MIEDYGSLSEEELLEEIIDALDENDEIDASGLEFEFVEGKLRIRGILSGEEDLEILAGILEDFMDPKDYVCEIELEDTPALTPSEASRVDEDDEEDEEYLEELEGFGEEDGEEFEEESEDLEDEKW